MVTSLVRRTGPLARLAVCGLLLMTGPGHAQDTRLAAANQATVDAFEAGTLPEAEALAEAAVRLGQSQSEPDPVAMAHALNNLGFLLLRRTGAEQRAAATLATAIDLAERTGQRRTLPWFLAVQNAVTAALRTQEPARAGALLETLTTAGRGSPFHADIAGAAADLAFAMADYQNTADLLAEMVAVGGTLRARITLDALYAAQEQAEMDGRITDAAALIDARITMVRVLDPAVADQFAHTALWTKFYMTYQAGAFGPAADALRVWAETGTMTATEKAFIESQASAELLFTQLSGFGSGRVTQLARAQLAVAFSDLVGAPDDPRRAWALRERAASETRLGNLAAAEQTLQTALAVLEQTAEGRRGRYLIIADLAECAWQTGNAALATRLYAQSHADYLTQVAAGLPPLPDFDLSISALNRARVAAETGDLDLARRLLSEAWQHFSADRARGAQKINQKAQEVALLIASALIEAQEGDLDAATALAHQAVQVARQVYPADHPDLALAFAQAADLLAVASQPAKAMALLTEADTINRAALPPDTPVAVDAIRTRVSLALTLGDRARALADLRRMTAARKSSEFRALLPLAAAEFEMLCWLLLDQPDPTGAPLDEAFQALQWTQITQSAEAVLMLEQRMSQSDPAKAALLRKRQTLIVQAARNRSALLESYAAGPGTAAQPATLLRAIAADTTDLAAVDALLAQTGLEMTGLATVHPASIATVQSLLAEDEALVTFVLPGLKADKVPGLQGSSNFAIALTRTEVQVARISQPSRGQLNDAITAFRCGIAVQDEGCGTGFAATVRGAMVADDPQDGGGFDPAAAQDLYQVLFGGIDAVIRDKAHLIIAPPGDLLRLPFAALVVAQPANDAQMPWLLRRHAISVVPSIPSFATLRGRAGARRAEMASVLGVGDPAIGAAVPIDCAIITQTALRSAPAGSPDQPAGRVFPANGLADPSRLALLPGLPDASCEIRAIAGAFTPEQATVLLQNSATEAQLKALNASGTLASYDLLAFATHGLLSGEAGAPEPGLVLTPPSRASALDDGLLSASEIATLVLDARLVILSACNTAGASVAGGDGLSGLARAFFQAGTQSLLVTHWSVYSDAATLVSSRLVTTLKRQPDLGPAKALRRSVLELIDDPRATALQQDPSYWAAFAVIGAD